MEARRSRKRDETSAGATHDGLSRRGWVLLVASTAAVGGALVAVALLTAGVPSGNARAPAHVTHQAASPHVPEPGSAPTPLGLPPRHTSTPVATVPDSPLDTLAPGACLQTYASKTEAGYPVVDCSAPHIAQLLTAGVLPEPADAAFPGTAALDTQVSDLCEPHLNWDWVAVWNEDVQLDLRYPDTSAQWATGARSYYCFVYTFSRHVLTGSAVAGE